MNETSDINKFIHALYFGNSGERRAAARQLVQIGDAAVEPLISALQSEYGPARATAAWALGEIGGSLVRTPLKTAVKDADPQVRKRAAEALGKTDASIVKLVKLALVKPTSHTCSRAFGFVGALLSGIKRILKNAIFRIINSVNLFLGRGVYNDAILSSYYSDYGRGHGMTVDINLEKLHSMLPAQAPCEECGAILQKPPLSLLFVGSCPQCHHIQEYARQSYHAAQAKLVRRQLRLSKKLCQHFESYLKKEHKTLHRSYRR